MGNDDIIILALIAGAGGIGYLLYTKQLDWFDSDSTKKKDDEDADATMDSYRYHNAFYLYVPISTDATFPELGYYPTTKNPFYTNSFRIIYSIKSANAQLVHWVVVADQTPPPHSFGKINTMMDNNLAGAIFG